MDLREVILKTIKIVEGTDLVKLYQEFLAKPLNKTMAWYANKMLVHKNLGQKLAGYNMGINEGEVAGQTIKHYHLHLIPRYFGDVDDPVGGVRNIIPAMGNYKNKF